MKKLVLRTNYLVALSFLVVLAGSGCGYNELQGLDEEVKGAWAEVQNQYQRRADLIPNLVATVKGAANFEQETLQKVIEARSAATSIKLDAQALSDPAMFKKFEDAQRNLSGALSRLLVVAEQYPTSRPIRTSATSKLNSKARKTVSLSPAAATVNQSSSIIRKFAFSRPI